MDTIKKRLVIALGALILVFILIYDFSEKGQDGRVRSKKEKTKSSLKSEIVKENDYIKEKVKNEEVLDQSKTHSEIERKLYEKADENISFYGRVVDQYNNPIEGVQIAVHIKSHNKSAFENVKKNVTNKENYILKTKTDVISLKSDDKGSFVIKGKIGRSLRVAELKLEGYVFEPKEMQTVFTYTSMVDKERRHVYRPDHPVVFKMWSKQQVKNKLYTRKIRKKVDIGKVNNVTFKTGLISGSSSGADISIVVNSKQGKDRKIKKWDWSFAVTCLKGGVQAAKDVYLLQAPFDGYEKEFNFKMSKTENDWKSNVNHLKLYHLDNTTKIYSTIKISVYPYRGGKALVQMEVVGNLDGGTNFQHSDR